MSATEIRILSEQDIHEALPMGDAVGAMKEAFTELSVGHVIMPARARIDVPSHAGTALFMPSYAERFSHIAVKVVNLFDGNALKGLPRIQGVVCLLDGETGTPLALLNGTVLTALRTGAASGAATDVLARGTADTAAIFGAGVQGRMQLDAMCAVRPIRKAWVYDPAREAAEAFAREVSATLGIEIVVAESPRDALRDAKVVCTATVSSSPVFADEEINPGTHINAIGSYQPHVQEIPEETVRRALVVVDDRESALAEAGDLIVPIRKGLMQQSDIHAELGEIVAGTVVGRTSDEQVTLFKSVGVAVQDLVAATRVFDNAQARGLGKVVDL